MIEHPHPLFSVLSLFLTFPLFPFLLSPSQESDVERDSERERDYGENSDSAASDFSSEKKKKKKHKEKKEKKTKKKKKDEGDSTHEETTKVRRTQQESAIVAVVVVLLNFLHILMAQVVQLSDWLFLSCSQ